MEGIIASALFIAGVVVIYAPVLDSGRGCGTLALMFRLSVEPLESAGSAFEIKDKDHPIKPHVDVNPKLEITDNQ